MEIWILITIGMGTWTIYWLFVRPVCLLATRMELFKIRHKLRTLSDIECPPQIRQKLEAFCNGSLRAISSMDTSDLIISNRRGDEVQAKRDIEDILSSTQQSKEIFEGMLKTVIAMMVASSALFLIPALIVIALAVWFSWFKSLIMLIKRRTWFIAVYAVEMKTPKVACP